MHKSSFLSLLALSGSALAQSATSGAASGGVFTFAPTSTTSRENTPVSSGLGYTPLNRKEIPYDQIPNKVDTGAWGRGPQSGTNLCNETTAGQDSQCQTAIFNSFEDFCLWGLPVVGNVGDGEAAGVVYCTSDTHGSRVMPPGTITSAQFTYTPEFITITGTIDQTALNIRAGDYGGEMDPVGEDYRGNPLGGLMYSTIFSPNGTLQQVPHWTQFIGADTFCIKLCQPGSFNATLNCEHIYDRSGCQVNMPYTPKQLGEFDVCYADVGLPVGRYYDEAGRLQTWTQPPVGVEVGTLPYSVMTPVSSNCSVPTSLPAALGGSASASEAVSLPASGDAVPLPSPLPSAVAQDAVSGAGPRFRFARGGL